MAGGEGSGTSAQAKETRESVKLLTNESSSALCEGRGVRKRFLPCTFLEPEECLELHQGGEDWGSDVMDTPGCSSEAMDCTGGSVGGSKDARCHQWPGEGRVLDFTSSKETVGVSLPPVMKQYVQSVVDSRWEQWRSEGRLSSGEGSGGMTLKTKYEFLLCKAEVHLCRLITTHLTIVGEKRARWDTYARGSANRRLIPTLDQVLQRMEKAEGVVKKVKRRKKKSSNYAYVRKKKKKKKTGQAVEAQQSVVREETKNIQSVSEDVEELPTTSATGGDGSQLFAAVCEDSSSVSSEDLDALMK